MTVDLVEGEWGEVAVALAGGESGGGDSGGKMCAGGTGGTIGANQKTKKTR